MLTIFRKELREHSLWIGLMFATAFIGMLFLAMVARNDPRCSLWQEFSLLMLFACPIVAGIIAALQLLPESRRDRWAFFVHRNVSMTDLFFGKLLAGLTFYMLVTVLPLMAAACYHASRSPQHLPFEWGMVGSPLLATIAGFAVYFGACIVVLRDARWVGTKLLPLAASLIPVVVTGVAIDELAPQVSLLRYVLTALAVVPFAIAAWGVFTQSGESHAIPLVPRACLAGCLLSVFLLIPPTIVSGAIGIAEGLQLAFTRTPYSYEVIQPSKENEFVRFTYIAESNQRTLRSVVNAVTGESLSTTGWGTVLRYGDDRSDSEKESKLLPVSSLVFDLNDQLRARGGRYGNDFVMPIGAYSQRVTWYYSRSRGQFVSYTWPSQYGSGEQQRSSELVQYVTPAGFFSAEEQSQQRFGRNLNESRAWRWASVGRAYSSFNRLKGYRHQALFENGIYDLNFGERTVTQLFAAPENRKIASIVTTAENTMLVVAGDSIFEYSSKELVVGKQRSGTGGDSQQEEDLILTLPDELIQKIVVPTQMQKYEHFEFGKRSDGQFVYRNTQRLSVLAPAVVVIADKAGRVAEQYVFHANPEIRSTSMGTVTATIMAVSLPVLPAAAVYVYDTFAGRPEGLGSGVFNRLISGHPAVCLCTIGSILMIALICVWYVRRLAARFGFSPTERRNWQLAAILLGVPGVLMMIGLRRWSVQEACHHCHRLSPVDQEKCVACGQIVEPPPRDGTQVIAEGMPLSV